MLPADCLQSEKISTILKAANVDVEPYWPGLFAKALEGVNVKDLITNVGSGAGAAAPAAAAAVAAVPEAAAKKEEEKKEESEEGSDDDLGFGEFANVKLFGVGRVFHFVLFLQKFQVSSNKNILQPYIKLHHFFLYSFIVQIK